MQKLKDEEVLYILDTQLPDMLDRHPEWQPRIYQAFMRAFVTRDEVTALFNELHQGQEKIEQRLDRVEVRLDRVETKVDKLDHTVETFQGEFHEFRGQVDQRFEQVDQRFDGMDQRFDGMDQRFDGMDQRFDGMDQRFGGMDQRFDGMDQRFDHLEQQFSDLKDWVHLLVGHFQVRAGRKLEDVVAGTLRLALQRPDISPDQIRMRQKIVDERGILGRSGKKYEIDILTDNGQITVFEVKSVCEAEDVDRLADKIELLRVLYPDKTVTGIMVALGVEEEAQERCAEYGIPLVY